MLGEAAMSLISEVSAICKMPGRGKASSHLTLSGKSLEMSHFVQQKVHPSL